MWLNGAPGGAAGSAPLGSWLFSGQLPNFEGLAHLKTLDLRENDPGFNGAIPDYIGDTGRNARGETVVRTFNIAGNNLTGTLPATIVHLTNLRVLNVSGNRLSGFIPELPSSLDDIENKDQTLRSRAGGLRHVGFVDAARHTPCGGH